MRYFAANRTRDSEFGMTSVAKELGGERETQAASSLLNIPIWRDASDPTSAGTTCIKWRKAISLFPIGIPAMTHAASELTNSIAGPSVDTKGKSLSFLFFFLRNNKRNACRDALKTRGSLASLRRGVKRQERGIYRENATPDCVSP